MGPPDSVCTQSERYKGLWEVPVWVLQNDNYPDGAYAMDPEARAALAGLLLLSRALSWKHRGQPANQPAMFERAACFVSPQGDVFGLLKQFFDKSYGGNRAPVPM